jgi:branched-subunit amino acid transport protein
MMIWLTIAGMALVTFLTRVIPMLAMRGDVVPWLRRWLGFVPVAVFTALVLARWSPGIPGAPS